MLELSVDTAPSGVVVVTPKGRLDARTAEAFERDLLTAINKLPARLVINCASLHYVSSIGLRALLVAAKQAKTNHVALILCALNEHIEEVFRITGFTKIFTIQPGLEDAVR